MSQALKLGIKKCFVEWRVVDQQFRALDELDQFGCNLRETRLVREKFSRQTVHLERCALAIPIGIDIEMQSPASAAPIEQLDTANFHDAISRWPDLIRWFRCRERSAWSYAFPEKISCACRRIRKQLQEGSAPRMASRSARSFSIWPAWPLDPVPFYLVCLASSVELAPQVAFFTGCFAALIQPRFFQPWIHSVMPLWT